MSDETKPELNKYDLLIIRTALYTGKHDGIYGKLGALADGTIKKVRALLGDDYVEEATPNAPVIRRPTFEEAIERCEGY